MSGTARLRWLVVSIGLVVALTATACGSGRGTADGDGTGDPTATSVEDSSTDFGDLASPCGPVEGDANVATEQGVTADSVSIGYGDDAGYQGSPGLNHQISDAVEALIDWCNEQGGVNGRTVVGHYYDAKITETANVVAEACRQDFMLVGSGWALAGSGETARLACRLPAVPGLVGGSDLGMAPLMVTPVPTVIDRNVTQVAAALAEAYPAEVKKAAVMVPPLPASVETIEKVQATYPDAGWSFLDCDQQYGLTGEADWKPFVQKLKDCGAEVVVFSGGNPNFQNVLDAAAQLDYRPIWLVESNFYDPAFAEWNSNGNADKVYLRFAFVPFGQAEPGSATQQYLDLVGDAGGDTSLLGAQAVSAFLLWATAAKDCGADLTRDCVMENLKAVHEWTGGGLHAEMDPGGNLPGPCGMVLKMEGTKFVQWNPATENQFDCDPSYLVEVDPPVAAAAALDLGPDRITTKNGTGE